MTDSAGAAVKRDGFRDCRCCRRGMADHGVILYRVRVQRHAIDFRAAQSTVLQTEVDVLVCAECSLRTPVAAMMPDRGHDL